MTIRAPTTTDRTKDGGTETPAASAAWDRGLRLFFRMTPHALMRGLRAIQPSNPIEELVVTGRKTGRPRKHQLTLLRVDGSLYVGHPNGRSHWARNLDETGEGLLLCRGSEPIRVRAVLLEPGPERSAAIAAAGRQPFPAGAVYTAARRHIEAVGAYYRLEPIDGEMSGVT
jgi:hypothetical protein